MILVMALCGFASPAVAKYDCDKGFQDHMAKMSVFVEKVVGFELADAYRKSLNVYDSCKAGDGFSPPGIWEQIEADMAAKARR
jgi:hypothetical protein